MCVSVLEMPVDLLLKIPFVACVLITCPISFCNFFLSILLDTSYEL